MEENIVLTLKLSNNLALNIAIIPQNQNNLHPVLTWNN